MSLHDTTSAEIVKPNHLRVYGCGGTGVNIAQQFDLSKNGEGHALLQTCFIDTSTSNLLRSTNMDDVFLIDKAEGSGKVRAEHHQKIAMQVNQILLKFEPAEMNIVIFSASGGSGSVIGPLLMRELLRREMNVVACVIITEESAIAVENSRKTMATLDQISRGVERPFICNLIREPIRDQADTLATTFIVDMAYLCSNQHLEMDNQDLHHFFYYDKPTKLQPSLMELTVHANRGDKKLEVQDAIAVAELHQSTQCETGAIPALYNCVGYPRHPAKSQEMYSFYYVISPGKIQETVEALEAKEQDYQRRKQARVTAQFVTKGDNVQDTDLVL